MNATFTMPDRCVKLYCLDIQLITKIKTRQIVYLVL